MFLRKHLEYFVTRWYDDHLKADLQRYARSAQDQHKLALAALFLTALARIEELEASAILFNGKPGGLAKWRQSTTEQRQQWGRETAKRRWGGRQAEQSLL